MATYTPKSLTAPKLMGNGAGNISTWSYQASAVTGIVRTHSYNSTSARTVTVQMGTVQADTAAQRIRDAYVLTVSVPALWNEWIVVPASSFFDGFANNTDVTAHANGYEYS